MPLFFNLLMLLFIMAIVALHILCAIAKRGSTSLNLLTLFLHIAALIPLLYFSSPLDAVAALYMASLAVRCVAFTLCDRYRRSKGENSGEVER